MDTKEGNAMPGILVVAIGLLVMAAGLLSPHGVLAALARWFVPGALLVYYLRARRILLRPASSEIFPVIASVLLSVIPEAWTRQLLPQGAPGLGLGGLTVWTEFAAAFSVGAVLLLEGMRPELLLPGWAVLRWGAAPSGFRKGANHSKRECGSSPTGTSASLATSEEASPRPSTGENVD